MLRCLACVLALLPCAIAQDASGNVTVMGDITITGALRTNKIRTNSLNVDGSMNVAGSVNADSITAKTSMVTIFSTPGISNPTGVVNILGPVTSSSASVNETLAVSSFIQRDVKQWSLAVHEDFEEKVTGWSSNAVSACEGNTHLAGHCNENDGQVSKTFSGLGTDHTHLRLRATMNFLDSWEGETAFAKLADKVVWAEAHDTRNMHGDAKSLCGGDHPDTKMGVPIDVTIPHQGDTVDVAFGGLLDEHPCNESFQIDNVQISIR